ncbi:hypothetical protein [Chromatium okenii]|uniref:hypothetical protein n=1 Tax=Chromatium okenii TaxID=61644 RepID=UPI0026EB9F2F|nr:hypothetical protein [Chromatium okenii]MBV5310278.1 hypothetical protein [Chromatium okenii]
MNKDTLIHNDSEQTSIAEDTHTDELDTKMMRRRLLKGAAFGAPVILTLRSGALMASFSCTGVSNATTTTESTAGCVPKSLLEDVKCAVPDSQVLTEEARTYAVQVTPTTDNSGNYYCQNEYAIISSAAYTSLKTF